ncbi:hypothetical protein EK21DRAFT_52211 [Setomelanomma holmii]|uniref:Uncharacterized protein n=1 Tax=Setomelanomma holmii TaxID=210430 RepID=A0A9P4LTH6_9PLEO|nr:hypothetical protein EK21DRAFT_52211 [Setomelanomma holmii]
MPSYTNADNRSRYQAINNLTLGTSTSGHAQGRRSIQVNTKLTTMAPNVHRNRLPRYTGGFSWDASTLQADIKSIMPEYDCNDPWTWPLITTGSLEISLRYRCHGKQHLPFGAVYEPELVKLFTTHHNDEELIVRKTSSGKKTLRRYFYYFPFAYDRSGRTTIREMMTSAAYRSSEQKIRADDAEDDKDTLKNLYEKKLLSEKRQAEAARQSHADLKDSLKRRAKKAEEEREKLKNETEALKKELEEGRQQLKETEQNLQSQQVLTVDAHAKNEKLCSNLETRDVELAQARKEVDELKEQMAKIRDEMRKAQGVDTQKRKAGDDGSDSCGKRARSVI